MTQLTDKTIGVFFGGQSPEHDISIVTGLLAMEELTKMGIRTEPIYITTDGSWCMGEELRDRDFIQDIHSRDLYSLQRWSLDMRHRSPHLILTRRPNFFSKREKKVIDIAFPAFHGAYGEDGAFQGLCELLGVPYVGSGVEGCTLSMNKALTKQMFLVHNIPTTKFISFSAREWAADHDTVVQSINDELMYPIFVKPVHAGSSIGITRVKDSGTLSEAIELALSFDTHCIVENGVQKVRDLTCCIRELPDGSLQASHVQESKFEGSDFFSYQEKYLKDGGAQLGAATQQLIIPAEIPEDISQKIKQLSLETFKKLGLGGIGRVDFLYSDETSEFFANEVNPMPGTLYHHLWKKTGVESSELLEGLLSSALNKYDETRKKNTYFPSALLGDLKGSKFTK